MFERDTPNPFKMASNRRNCGVNTKDPHFFHTLTLFFCGYFLHNFLTDAEKSGIYKQKAQRMRKRLRENNGKQKRGKKRLEEREQGRLDNDASELDILGHFETICCNK